MYGILLITLTNLAFYQGAGAAGLPDLIIKTNIIPVSSYVETVQLGDIECAVQEGCLGDDVKVLMKKNADNWRSIERKLLRFETTSTNIGLSDLVIPGNESTWEYHECHEHYHSVKEYANFSVLKNNTVVLRGNKLSFCLEDTICGNGVDRNFICDVTEEQGISVGCSDVYSADLDCQWVDITNLSPGNYSLKMVVNPKKAFKEITYDNNGALCDFTYNGRNVTFGRCKVTGI